mgnify:CR=1 FL=1
MPARDLGTKTLARMSMPHARPSRVLRLPRWGRFQGRLIHPSPPSDPWRAVELHAQFRAPSGRLHRHWGYFDGGSAWGFRFRPDETGSWHYHASFSDGAAAVEGTFEVTEGTLAGPVCLHEHNPRWFGRRGGGRFFPRGLHVGDRYFAANWPVAKRRRFLTWFRQQGYNLISVASCFVNRDADGRGRGWDTPALWPLDPSHYARLETLLDELESRDIVLFPFAGFFGQDGHHPTEPADQTLYLRYALARLGWYRNIILNVAGPEPNLKARPWMPIEDVVRLGQEIATLDPYGTPLTVHNETGDDEFKHADWCTYGTLQGPKTVSRTTLFKGLRKNRHWAKPLFAQETLWTGNFVHLKNNPAEPRDEYTEDDVRKNGWTIALIGAGLCYADNQGTSSTGFSGTMELRDRRQRYHDILKAIWDFMETLPFERMQPVYDAADLPVCLAEPGRDYLFYLEAGGSLTLNIPEPEGYRATWIDARDTTKQRPAKPDAADAKRYTVPAGGDDWLLRLKRR